MPRIGDFLGDELIAIGRDRVDLRNCSFESTFFEFFLRSATTASTPNSRR
jgi:hypothetical protein